MDSFWKCLSSIGERYTAPRNEVRSALLAKAIRRELLASLPSDYDRFDEDARLEELDKYVCPRPDYVAAALMLPSMKTYSLDALPVSPNQFRAIEALKADWQLRISTDEAELHENFDEAKEFADNGLTSLAYAPLRLVLISMPAALARAEDDASKTQLLGLLQLARRLAFDVEMAENFLLPAATIADLLLPECDPAVGDGYAIWHKTLKLLALLAMPVDTSTLSDAFVSGQQREAAMHLWELLCQASKAPNFWDAGRWADARHRNSLRSTSAQTAATLLAMQQRACPEFIARSLPSMHGMRFVGGRYAWMDAVATRQEFRSLYSPLPNRVEDLLQSMKAFERTG